MIDFAERSVGKLLWRADLAAAAWNRELAALRGHPLQSTLWGDARRAVDGIEDHRWAAFLDARPVFLARFETRRLSPFGRVAWLPKGPAAAEPKLAAAAYGEFLERLRQAGYFLCIDDAYRGGVAACAPATALPPNPRTAWIDLSIGRERLQRALDSQWRYGVRSAGRAGVAVEQSRDSRDVSAFFGLCEHISRAKQFELPGSEALLQALCAAPPSMDAEARLFVARLSGELVAGAMVLRCGKSLHYMWGGVDRRFSKQRPGEAVQWGIIEWAVENGLEAYDLEGIDPERNPGTYRFKMKMGAAETDLPGKRAYPLTLAGRLALGAGRWLGRL